MSADDEEDDDEEEEDEDEDEEEEDDDDVDDDDDDDDDCETLRLHVSTDYVTKSEYNGRCRLLQLGAIKR